MPPIPPSTLQAVKVNSLGKWKTALQMVAMTALLVLRHADLILGPGYESGERGPGVWPGITESCCAGKPLPGDEHLSKLVAGALCTGQRRFLIEPTQPFTGLHALVLGALAVLWLAALLAVWSLVNCEITRCRRGMTARGH